MINRKAFLQKRFNAGFINKKSGYPLSLEKCLKKYLLDYKIYGNSIQDGTPTPENPIDVLSLGENESIDFKANDRLTTISLTGHEPLRKIREIADYIDYRNSRIVRNIGIKIFDGSETIVKNYPTNNESYLYYLPKNNFNLLNYSNRGLCNYVPYSINAPLDIKGINFNDTFSVVYINLGETENNTVEGLKTYLSDLYKNGNPLIIYYVLETPTYENIELPNIQLEKGTNILTAYDELLDSSNISTVYRSKRKEI